MTKEITKSFILQEMADKFGLREFEPEPFIFSEVVVPIYNIEQHLEKWKTQYVTKSITGTGPSAIITVPAREKWHLRRYDVVFMTGAYTIAGLYTFRAAHGSGKTCYLDLGLAKSASYHVDLINPVALESGTTIYTNVDGYTSTGDLRVYVDYMVEEIR